jgi:hypothetical protein
MFPKQLQIGKTSSETVREVGVTGRHRRDSTQIACPSLLSFMRGMTARLECVVRDEME